jgi:ferredoxin
MTEWKYLEGVVTLSFDEQKCVGCGMCETVCPRGVFIQGQARKAAVADRDLCIECGACARNCPTQAVTVHPGVGCAGAILQGWLTGTEPNCGCDSGSGSGCC